MGLSGREARPQYALEMPHAGRHPRQHHALLADEYGCFFGASLYWENKLAFFAPKGAVSVFPDEISPAPRSWTEKAYPKLIYYKRRPKGAHFAAWEQASARAERSSTAADLLLVRLGNSVKSSGASSRSFKPDSTRVSISWRKWCGPSCRCRSALRGGSAKQEKS